MASMLKSLRLLGDPGRLRVLLLLEREELSVAELQEILSMGQSRISTHLAQLKAAGLVQDRRSGKSILYRLRSQGDESVPFRQLLDVLRHAAAEIPAAAQDSEALRMALHRRRDKTRASFDTLAKKFGKQYVPGRSWEGLAEALLLLMPAMVIADLGAGEGTFSQLLARRAKRVIAVDNSEKMVTYGREVARKHGVKNLEYRIGDIEEVPLRDATVDLAFFSQALHHAKIPQRAVGEAHRILKPGGRIVVLDLVRHQFEEARQLYRDQWLGFTETEVSGFLRKGGFRNIATSVVHREEEAPHFETILAVADR
jgi:ubiquinone/menaquinone biosynthesis C-methylase UbiE/biotin operon repressor